MLGYPCICLSLEDKKITTNRSMIRKTFDQKGLSYASELSLKNCNDLYEVLKWNKENNILFFRISSNIFPWASEYDIENLDDIDDIKKSLKKSGDFIKENGMRITSHPGPYNKLCSNSDSVVKNTIKDLEIHGKVFDMLGLPKTPFAKINIHIGATYGDKESCIKRFVSNFEKLTDSVSKRLTIENDDKESMYSTFELVRDVSPKINVPIVHDIHHHNFCNYGISQKQALEFAMSTWPIGIKPVVHYSESRSDECGDKKIKPQAHSDFLKSKIETYGYDVDIMLETKKKDLALLKYKKDNNLLNFNS